MKKGETFGKEEEEGWIDRWKEGRMEGRREGGTAIN